MAQISNNETLLEFYNRVNKELEIKTDLDDKMSLILEKIDIISGGNVSSETIHKIFDEIKLSFEIEPFDGGNKIIFNTGQSLVIKDGVLEFENFSQEDITKVVTAGKDEIFKNLERATSEEAINGENKEKLMTPYTTHEAIENVKNEYRDRVIALTHLADDGKDLINEDGKLYRHKVVVENGDPIIRKVEVGALINNSNYTFTIPEGIKKARIFFKAQSEEPTSNSKISFWIGNDESQKEVSDLENWTKEYSKVFDLSTSHDVVISTAQLWDKNVKVWDVDWKEVL